MENKYKPKFYASREWVNQCQNEFNEDDYLAERIKNPTPVDVIDNIVCGSLVAFTQGLFDSLTPKRIIVNGPALVIFWKDGDKTVVKCHDEDFDIEKGISMALAKRVWGSRNKMNKLIKMVEYQDEDQNKKPTSLKGKNILQVIIDELNRV